MSKEKPLTKNQHYFPISFQKPWAISDETNRNQVWMLNKPYCSSKNHGISKASMKTCCSNEWTYELGECKTNILEGFYKECEDALLPPIRSFLSTLNVMMHLSSADINLLNKWFSMVCYRHPTSIMQGNIDNLASMFTLGAKTQEKTEEEQFVLRKVAAYAMIDSNSNYYVKVLTSKDGLIFYADNLLFFQNRVYLPLSPCALAVIGVEENENGTINKIDDDFYQLLCMEYMRADNITRIMSNKMDILERIITISQNEVK